MKVQNLSTPVQPNAQWTIFFTAPNGTEYFVDMNTEGASTTPVFQYGHVTVLATGNRNLNTDGSADAGSTFSADGTILLIIDNSKVGGLKAGDQLVNINGQTQALIGAGGTGLLATIDSTSAGRYILVGNEGCAPKAVLTANPTSGSAPLTVSFSGAGSSDPDGDAISSYSFNFGDGTKVTQSSPTVKHQYSANGKYTATLTVADAGGTASPVPASATINVSAASCSTTLNGSGTIKGTSASFTLTNVESNLTGTFTYTDTTNNIKFTSTKFTSFSLDSAKKCVTFAGTATLSTGGNVSYTATACDNDDSAPSSADSLSVKITGAKSSSQSGQVSNIELASVCK
jgi:PKD repeat protein